MAQQHMICGTLDVEWRAAYDALRQRGMAHCMWRSALYVVWRAVRGAMRGNGVTHCMWCSENHVMAQHCVAQQHGEAHGLM